MVVSHTRWSVLCVRRRAVTFCLSDCRRYQLERTDTDIQMQSGVEFELRFVVGAARIVCGAGSMKLPGVRPSVCLSVRPSHHSAAAARRCGGFVAERRIAAGALLQAHRRSSHCITSHTKFIKRCYAKTARSAHWSCARQMRVASC